MAEDFWPGISWATGEPPRVYLSEDHMQLVWEHDCKASYRDRAIRDRRELPLHTTDVGKGWQLVAIDPLHIEPSILCGVDQCGLHGFVRDGHWVPA